LPWHPLGLEGFYGNLKMIQEVGGGGAGGGVVDDVGRGTCVCVCWEGVNPP